VDEFDLGDVPPETGSEEVPVKGRGRKGDHAGVTGTGTAFF
jgi:hypothetical protein